MPVVLPRFLLPKSPCLPVILHPTGKLPVKFVFKGQFLVDVGLHDLSPQN